MTYNATIAFPASTLRAYGSLSYERNDIEEAGS